mgnify:FL=1
METNASTSTSNGTANLTPKTDPTVPAPDFSEQFNTMREEFNARFDALEAAGNHEPAPQPKDEDDLEKSSPAFAQYMKKRDETIYQRIKKEREASDDSRDNAQAQEKLMNHPDFSADLARKMAKIIIRDGLGSLPRMKAIAYAYREITGKNFESANAKTDIKENLGDGVKGNAPKAKAGIFERIKNAKPKDITPEMEAELSDAMRDGSFHKEIVDKYGEDFS